MTSKGEQAYRWRFGAADFDESTLELRRHGKPVHLEPKPLKLLSLLLRNHGEVVTREEIVAEVWEDRVTVDHTISTAIGKLRKALGEEPGITIETVPRAGYRLSGEVERVAVGRVMANRLELTAGASVPGRPEWILVDQLVSTVYNDIWLARHRESQRERVVKFAAEGKRLSRLKREAALNRLLVDATDGRDDIVPPIDTNFSEPPFFLAYEHEGQNLRDWAESSSHFKQMDTGQRLNLFLRICSAVSAAHEIGILHKDIKPQNILIRQEPDGNLQVKLADFGNSEMLEPDQLKRLSLTAEGVAITRDSDSSSGTFMYMAPELLHTGAATVRSDVFALGVLLFQLLTGDFQRPLVPGWRRDIDDELLADDIARATDHDPDRRLTSVNELAKRIEKLPARHEDLERHRRDQAALEQSRRTLEKQRARRPWVLGMVASLVIGLGVSLHLYREAEQGRQQAEAFADRMEAVQRFLSEDIISRANPLDPSYEPDAGIISILEAAANRIEPRFGDSPRAAAVLHRSIARAFEAFRRDEEAFEHYQTARDLYAQSLGDDHPTTARVGYQQALALINAGDYEQARDFLESMDKRSDQAHRKFPEVAFQRAFGYARLHAGLHDMPSARDYFEQARGIHQSAFSDTADDYARVQLGLVDAYLRLDQPERALKLLNELQDRADFDELPGDIGALATRNHARILRDLGDDEEALSVAGQSVDQMTELYGKTHYQTIVSLSLVAQLQDRLDDCDGTLATSQQVFELMGEVYGPDNSATLIEQANLGMKQFGCGHPDEGIANLRTSIDGLEEQFGAENRAVHQISFHLATYLQQSGEHREALALLDQLVEIALDKTDGVAVTPAEILLWRARALTDLDRINEAHSTLEDAESLASSDSRSEDIIDKIEAKLEAISTASG